MPYILCVMQESVLRPLRFCTCHGLNAHSGAVVRVCVSRARAHTTRASSNELKRSKLETRPQICPIFLDNGECQMRGLQ